MCYHDVMNSNHPYIKRRVSKTLYCYNPDFGNQRICEDPNCGHEYYRHFDTYEGMANVGCKYCPCYHFKVKTIKQ